MRRKPLTTDEAMVSVVLSAVSGGLFEIGDDLPTLWKSPDRLAWLKNRDLLDMVHLGRAATPIDLLTYEKDDLEPSVFVLKESNHQSIVAIFNWTESLRSHDLSVAQLGLDKDGTYNSIEVLDPTASLSRVQRTLHVRQPPHSVRLIKLLDNSTRVEAVAPRIVAPSSGKTGENIEFSSDDSSEANPVVMYRWDFGDGTTLEGQHVTHAFTKAGNYDVTLTIVGLAEASTKAKFPISVTGSMSARFNPETKRRLPLDER
jgi:alpha-galactosidase